jgi:hypothetical protein
VPRIGIVRVGIWGWIIARIGLEKYKNKRAIHTVRTQAEVEDNMGTGDRGKGMHRQEEGVGLLLVYV